MTSFEQLQSFRESVLQVSFRTCEGLRGPQLPKGQASFSLQTQDKTLRMQLRLLFAFGLLEWLVWRWGKVQRCFISLRGKKVSAHERGRKKAQMIHRSLHDRPDWETDFGGKEERLTCVLIFDYFFDCAVLLVALGILDRHCNTQGLWFRHGNS